jgi:hypothetical protein
MTLLHGVEDGANTAAERPDGPMRWTQAFVALLLRFAARVAEAEGVSMDEALLTSTPLYLSFGLTPSFSPQDPTWQEFLAGYHDASQPVTWTHSFYLAHAREYGESPFGCFSYAYESETRTIGLHFGNRDASRAGPLSEERQQVRRAELTALFADVRREVPAAQAVSGGSWLYNLAAYRRLFPPAYVRTAVPVAPALQFMSLWGQFLDRHGEVRPGPTTTFLDRIATATTLDALMRSFPLPVRAPRCSIEHFYAFYGLN